jgi:ribosomal protein L16/L10AE
MSVIMTLMMTTTSRIKRYPHECHRCHAGWHRLDEGVQGAILDIVASRPRGTALLRGVCRRFQVHALQYAHRKSSTTMDEHTILDAPFACNLASLESSDG